IPSEDLHFIAPSATLAIHQDLHPALIDILMQISTEVHQSNSLFSENNTFPSPDNLDLPLSKEAERFYKNGPSFLQRYLPFWAATLIDRLKVMLLPLIALIIPLAKILPPTYRWRIRSRIYRWYDELHTLDLNARSEGSSKIIKISLEKLTIIELEVQQIEVPLSYAEELYNLRQHLDLLKRQLKELLVETEASTS
ncbi:MAG: C4-dicarboxylate ABC transporter substrate-binding protein, partial [Desulfobulbaceae bacterium]|nr:C4-dicarboxylate ABC transporter substrate-binding protein [Desulfobulbaceae bacterium]